MDERPEVTALSQDEPDDDFVMYRLDLSFSHCLWSGEPEDEYIIGLHGAIHQLDADGNEVAVAGHVRAYLVDCARASEEEGLSLADVLDLDLLTSTYARGLVGPDGELREDIVDEVGFIERILILDDTQILPTFRGRGLGMWADYRILDTFALQGVLPVQQPVPVQFSPRGAGKKGEEMGVADLPQDKAAAYEKVASYWARMGYDKVWQEGDEQIWILNPTTVKPDRRDVLGTHYDL